MWVDSCCPGTRFWLALNGPLWPPYLLAEEVNKQSLIFTRKMEFFSCQLRQVADL